VSGIGAGIRGWYLLMNLDQVLGWKRFLEGDISVGQGSMSPARAESPAHNKEIVPPASEKVL
jgi:hypothetical protein